MQTTHVTDLRTHVIAPVLDRAAGRALKRFSRRVSAKDQSEATVDMRSTHVVTSEGWAALVGAIIELFDRGRDVTVVGNGRVRALFELSGLVRKARLVMGADAA